MRFPALIIGSSLAIYLLVQDLGKPAAKSSLPQLARPTNSSGNIAHDQLVDLPARERIAFLAHVVRSVGDQCSGSDDFFMGIDRTSHQALWNVRCSNGRAYEIAIEANSTGSTKVLDCAILKRVANVACFQRLEEQR